MTTQKRLLWISGIVVLAIVALYLGVPPGTLLIVGALLLCPAAMYFGMRGKVLQDQQERGVKQERSRESELAQHANKDKDRAA